MGISGIKIAGIDRHRNSLKMELYARQLTRLDQGSTYTDKWVYAHKMGRQIVAWIWANEKKDQEDHVWISTCRTLKHS